MTGFVTDAQMASLRSTANKGLTQEFTVFRKTRVENDFGFADEWSEVGSGLCWLRNMNKPRPGEQTGHIEGAEATYRFHCEYGTDIRTGDRVETAGNSYEVSDVNTDNTVQIYRTAVLRAIQ